MDIFFTEAISFRPVPPMTYIASLCSSVYSSSRCIFVWHKQRGTKKSGTTGDTARDCAGDNARDMDNARDNAKDYVRNNAWDNAKDEARENARRGTTPGKPLRTMGEITRDNVGQHNAQPK